MRHFVFVGVLIAAFGLAAQAQAPPFDSAQGKRPAARATGPVTFAKDVAPILHSKCISSRSGGCRRGLPIPRTDRLRMTRA